jgi:hypothetical protein
LYGTGTWTLRKVEQKYLDSFEMWFRRRREISCTECVKNEEVLHRVKEERNIVHTIKEGRLTALVTSCVGTVFRKHY